MVAVASIVSLLLLLPGPLEEPLISSTPNQYLSLCLAFLISLSSCTVDKQAAFVNTRVHHRTLFIIVLHSIVVPIQYCTVRYTGTSRSYSTLSRRLGFGCGGFGVPWDTGGCLTVVVAASQHRSGDIESFVTVLARFFQRTRSKGTILRNIPVPRHSFEISTHGRFFPMLVKH